MTDRRIEVLPVTDDTLRAAAYAIRFDVFVEEQGVSPDTELDALDLVAEHLLVTLDGAPVATGRLVTESPGFEGADPGLGSVAHVGRIAVRIEQRGTGLGAVVVRALEDLARDAGLRTSYLSAQVVAIPFYEKLGYTAHGEPYLDENIPHRHMTRTL